MNRAFTCPRVQRNAEVVLCGGWSGLLAERLSDYAWVPELTLEGGRVFGRKASLAAG